MKESNLKNTKWIWIVLAIAAVMSVSACSARHGHHGDNKGSAQIDTGKGKTTLSTEAEWPKGFPTDIPKPKGMVVTASSVSEDSSNMTVAIETQQPFNDVLQIYKNYIEKSGFIKQLDANEDNYFMYSGLRGDEMITFTFGLDEEDGKTVTGALVYKKKATIQD